MFPMRRKGAQFWTGVTGPHPNGARRSFVVGSHASEHVGGGNGSKKRRHITRVTSDVGNAVTLHTSEGGQTWTRFECFIVARRRRYRPAAMPFSSQNEAKRITPVAASRIPTDPCIGQRCSGCAKKAWRGLRTDDREVSLSPLSLLFLCPISVIAAATEKLQADSEGGRERPRGREGATG